MKIILNGGGSGEEIRESKNLFASLLDKNKPLLYIPSAMDPEKHPYDDCLVWIKSEFEEHNLPIEMISDLTTLNSSMIENFSGVFVGGGNTFKLLKLIKESSAKEFFETAIANNLPIMGGSAGALIFSKDIITCLKDEDNIKSTDENIVGLQDTSAFDTIDGAYIFVHYGQKEDQLERSNEKLTQLSKKLGKIIALPEDVSLFVDNGNISYVGKNHPIIFENGETKVFHNPNKELIFE